MNRARRHPLLALLCALFLLGAQQAAYAHFLGHLGLAPHAVMQEGNDAEHGAASTLSHVCTTCAAFAALDATPPAAAMAMPPAHGPAQPPASQSGSSHPATTAPPYASRAPPAVL